MKPITFKALHKRDAGNLATIAGTVLFVAELMVCIQALWKVLRGTATVKTIGVSCIVFVIMVGITMILSNTLNWQISPKITISDKGMVLTHLEAVTFLGVSGVIKHDIKELKEVRKHGKGIQLIGTFNYSAQMEKNRVLKKVDIHCPFEDEEYAMNVLNAIIDMGGEVTEARISELRKRFK